MLSGTLTHNFFFVSSGEFHGKTTRQQSHTCLLNASACHASTSELVEDLLRILNRLPEDMRSTNNLTKFKRLLLNQVLDRHPKY